MWKYKQLSLRMWIFEITEVNKAKLFLIETMA